MLSKFYTLGKVIPEKNDRIREVLLDHYDYLRNHAETTIHNIDDHQAYVARFNLYRYLKDEGYEVEQIYPIMVINNIKSLHELDTDLKTLLIPSMSALEEIKSSMK